MYKRLICLVAMSSSKTFFLLTFSAVALILVAESYRETPLIEQEKEMETLLNHINKPAIKSFQAKFSLPTN
ncbi:unnamed protein product [Thlaspi arvense]|uniref:Uncharacterized protein n=1 Tax=Thlaspi arvense TaxID=13288 RepID=A0AAU9T1U5_THLAR|nr:unnamed protein product [Thlaspi arvense]